MGWGGRWERGSERGTHVHPWLIHVNVWQKPPQYCKVISLQLNLNFFLKIEGGKNKSRRAWRVRRKGMPQRSLRRESHQHRSKSCPGSGQQHSCNRWWGLEWKVSSGGTRRGGWGGKEDNFTQWVLASVQFSSVAQSCLTLCNPTDCSTSGFPVYHQLLELTQTLE